MKKIKYTFKENAYHFSKWVPWKTWVRAKNGYSALYREYGYRFGGFNEEDRVTLIYSNKVCHTTFDKSGLEGIPENLKDVEYKL